MAMRRPNGSGSIVKLSGRRRRPYAVRVFDGIEITPQGNGIKKYKYLGYFEKQGDALRFLEKFNSSPVTLASAKQGRNKHKFSEIYEMYISDLENRSRKLSRQSFDSRRAAFKQLKPLHNMIFENITLDDLESVTRQKSNLSQSSITNIKIVLKGMYKTAMRHKFVNEDLAALMIVDYSDEIKRPHVPFTDSEIELLWEHSAEFYPRLFLILIYTGMRINELLEMKTSNVFIKERYMIGGSKTKAGKNRKIPIAEKIVPLLDTSKENLIFVKDGRKLSYSKARYDCKAVMESLNLDHTYHDTRHTCTSLLERAGVPKLHIKLILGHASQDITDHYTHVSVKELINDINKI